MIDEPADRRGGSPLDDPVYEDRRDPAGRPSRARGPACIFLAWTATDARFFRTLGVPTYGFSPFLIMNTDT